MTPKCLEAIIADMLAWYAGCDACQETVDNINRELSEIKLSVPYVLRAHLDDGIIVVRPYPWTTN